MAVADVVHAAAAARDNPLHLLRLLGFRGLIPVWGQAEGPQSECHVLARWGLHSARLGASATSWSHVGRGQVLSALPALGSHPSGTGVGTAARAVGSTCGGADHAPHCLPALHQLLHRVQAPLPMLLNIFHLGKQGGTAGCPHSPCLGQGTDSTACPLCSSPTTHSPPARAGHAPPRRGCSLSWQSTACHPANTSRMSSASECPRTRRGGAGTAAAVPSRRTRSHNPPSLHHAEPSVGGETPGV